MRKETTEGIANDRAADAQEAKNKNTYRSLVFNRINPDGNMSITTMAKDYCVEGA
ncbi:MAG: hypothetical protein OSA51_10945 [Octadecabacter sp.]|nr:hypothetical protein [Octadecabacter sp.]